MEFSIKKTGEIAFSKLFPESFIKIGFQSHALLFAVKLRILIFVSHSHTYSLNLFLNLEFEFVLRHLSINFLSKI